MRCRLIRAGRGLPTFPPTFLNLSQQAVNKKTLLQVRYGYPGLGITCNEYLEALPSAEYAKIVVFLCGPDNPLIRQQVPADEVIFLNLSKRSLKGLALKGVMKLRAICKKNRVHTVLAHRYKSFKIAVLVGFLCPFLRVFGVFHRFGSFKTLSRKLLGTWALKRGYKIIAVSEALQQDILSARMGGTPKEIIAIANCIDSDLIEEKLYSRQEARAFFKLPESRFVVGTIARLSKAKDLPTLLKAFAEVKKRLPEAHLLIVGEGHMQSALEKQCQELCLDSCVTLTGRVDGAWKVIPAFDVFALSSVEEPFGRVLLEAMAAKTPIVATNTAGAREVLGSGYHLSGVRDYQGLADSIVHMATMDQQQKSLLIESLYHRLTENFNRQVFQKKLLSCIDNRL